MIHLSRRHKATEEIKNAEQETRRTCSRPKFLAISAPKQAVNAVDITFSVFGRPDFCRHVRRVILLDTALECVAYWLLRNRRISRSQPAIQDVDSTASFDSSGISLPNGASAILASGTSA